MIQRHVCKKNVDHDHILEAHLGTTIGIDISWDLVIGSSMFKPQMNIIQVNNTIKGVKGADSNRWRAMWRSRFKFFNLKDARY